MPAVSRPPATHATIPPLDPSTPPAARARARPPLRPRPRLHHLGVRVPGRHPRHGPQHGHPPRPRGRPGVRGPLGDPAGRPARRLVGFAGVRAEPGARVEAEIRPAPRAFDLWDEETGAWTTVPGRSLADTPSPPSSTSTDTPSDGSAGRAGGRRRTAGGADSRGPRAGAYAGGGPDVTAR
ncbi:fibronectin type III-like domain-contianing protein [Streptomyces sp. MRC013]|uniref:fibronectin type III-like domain-contianing protein n=1 Tax=Streptomyces sp. MRC013 TaxID=2898276 RepID=UPI0032EA407A